MRRRYLGVGIAGAAILAAVILWPRSETSDLKTAVVTRGPVEQSVVASGTLTPTRTVQVGAETSGLVSIVRVDVGDRVVPGQVLAELDPARLDAAVRQAAAQVAVARAATSQAAAAIMHSTAEMKEANLARQRAVTLGARGVVSRRALEAAEVAESQAQSELNAANAQVAMRRAEFQRAEAQYSDAATARRRSRIVSPSAGVVIRRAVDPGQTLASTFQTPVLFEIADDLSRMRISARIHESDIASVRSGQDARFTVEAFPGRTYVGKVVSLAPQAVDTNGVVSFPVIIEFANRGGLLKPGMSANVEILTAQKAQAVRVPVAALSFTPPNRKPKSLPWVQNFSVGPSRGNASGAPKVVTREIRTSAASPDQPTVWRFDEDAPGGLVAVRVRPGVRGEEWVEITGGDVKVGDRIAVGSKRTTPTR